MSKVTGPLFKWFGSKWLSSKYLPAPKHRKIFEPYAGGAAYSLRYADRSVAIAETNASIRRLWEWIIDDATSQDVRDIPLDVPEGTDIRTLGLSDGQALLLKNWQRTNNFSECWTISAWNGKPGLWSPSIRSRVAEEIHAVKHWRLYDSAEAIFIRCIGEIGTWFIDAPYQYNFRYGKTPIDYQILADYVHCVRGQRIVCEADCQKTGTRPTWLPFETWKRRITSSRKPGQRNYSNELIYVKDDLDVPW